jgi:hypothetical protein
LLSHLDALNSVFFRRVEIGSTPHPSSPAVLGPLWASPKITKGINIYPLCGVSELSVAWLLGSFVSQKSSSWPFWSLLTTRSHHPVSTCYWALILVAFLPQKGPASAPSLGFSFQVASYSLNT